MQYLDAAIVAILIFALMLSSYRHTCMVEENEELKTKLDAANETLQKIQQIIES